MGPNQVQIVGTLKTQPDGTTQVITTNNQLISDSQNAQQTQQPQIVHQQPQPQQHVQQKYIIQHVAKTQPITSTPTVPKVSVQSIQQVLSPTTEQSLLEGQPPGTIIKCVTAEVTKNQNGPCIKLTGLQGTDFTQQQLAMLHQQVKQQLVKKCMKH